MLIFLVFWILRCRFFFSVLYSYLPTAVFTYHTMYWANWWVYIGQDDKEKKLLLHLVAIFNCRASHTASHTVYTLAFVFHHVAMWIKTHFVNNDQVVHLEFWGDSIPCWHNSEAAANHCARGGNIFRPHIEVLFLQVTNRLAPSLRSKFPKFKSEYIFFKTSSFRKIKPNRQGCDSKTFTGLVKFKKTCFK